MFALSRILAASDIEIAAVKCLAGDALVRIRVK